MLGAVLSCTWSVLLPRQNGVCGKGSVRVGYGLVRACLETLLAEPMPCPLSVLPPPPPPPLSSVAAV